MKKIVWRILVVTMAAGIVFWAIGKGYQPAPVEHEGQIMQVITADMKHARTISWRAPASKEAGSLEFRPKEGKTGITVQAEKIELPIYNGGSPFSLYTAALTGLTAGTEYEYRISVGKRQSPWLTFTTEPEGNIAFKALVFGDSQSVDYRTWGKTAHGAWEKNKDAAFFINMGDIVDNGQDEGQWNAWFDAGKALLATMPVAPVMGNHEAYSLDWKMALPEYYLAFFAVPANGPTALTRQAYSYDYGEVHFVVLNTQQNELKEWYPALLKEQQRWLAQDLAATKKPWKVVLMHRGIWEYPFKGALDEIGNTFVPLFDQFHVDLVFTAHVHSYARTKPLKKGKEDPSGTVYITTGRSGEKVWDKSPQKPMDETFYNPLDMPNYLVLEASSQTLKVDVFKQNGERLDSTEIRKTR